MLSLTATEVFKLKIIMVIFFSFQSPVAQIPPLLFTLTPVHLTSWEVSANQANLKESLSLGNIIEK